MITISDCEAFCDADSGWARELAHRERLSMVQAYAQAHRSMTGAAIPVMQTHPVKSVDVDSSYCRAA